MRREKPEWVPADRRTRQNLLILIALYILLLVWLEPLIDFALSFDPVSADPFAMGELNRRKLIYVATALAAVRSVPIGLFFWLGYRIIASASIPPARMKFPITVQRIKGRQARLYGLLLMSICLFLLYWEMVQLSRKLLA